MAVTLAQVASLAGVSQPTASRVLNGSARTPAPHVVEAVRKAADQLGYIANAQAQALVRSSSRLLGLVVHDIADSYFSTIAAGVERAAEERQLQVMLAVTGRDPLRELAAVQTFISHRADAVVMAGSQWSGKAATDVRGRLLDNLERFVDDKHGAAVIGPRVEGLSAVTPENRRGAGALANALLDAGTRDFIVLSGPPGLVTGAERTAGFTAALKRRGVTARRVPGDLSRDGGFEAAQQVFAELPSGDVAPCLFAVTDVMAIGAAAAARLAGLRIPEDVQIAGFDDIVTLRDFTPGLTTVHLPLEEMGYRAAMLATEGAGARSERAPATVVLRESTLNPGS
ncbi:LacI family DNA-binding transcriptional regulator [Nocardioides sp. GXZ039]|uniref:LacI family DNA-binding transcriptional regulator n=1 Tax=Nocardioides sp. GXZ039 TaxID=3136018 RepID=UPI0030F377F3